MRRKFIAGNWKMFTNAASAQKLTADIVAGLGKNLRADIAVCPPFPYLQAVAQIVKGTPIQLGAQNLYPEKEGAFTGEVSPAMLVDVGCQWVILGHSERRKILGETDAFINRKVHATLASGLRAIVCIGETLEERETNQMEAVLQSQLSGSLAKITKEQMAHIVIAYEPVWAIGTGRNATPDQAQAAHVFIRKQIASRFSQSLADAQIIQYGGSAKPENVAALLSQPDVDGALVGGASLKSEWFLAIIDLS